jgi:GT2 family glycosyltransferase
VKLSLVLVSHHSSAVLAECATSFRREADSAGVASEVVVVEQSEDEAELERVTGLGIDRIRVGPNRGYAAGLNTGVSEASGDVLMLANPDIRFLEGSVGALLRALEKGFDVVGPKLVWDPAASVLLPVAEDPAPVAELGRTLRRRWQAAWSAGLKRSLEQIWRIWSAEGAVAAPCLRGPLMVLSRSGFEELGPLEEGYFLYYEDTEWMWRARRRGARIGVAADASVMHRWGHATEAHPERLRIEEESRQRFFERNYGAMWRRAMAWSAGGPERSGPEAQPVPSPEEISCPSAELWLVSYFRHLIPAVGWIGGYGPPAALAELVEHGRWYCLAAARDRGAWRVLASWTWERP